MYIYIYILCHIFTSSNFLKPSLSELTIRIVISLTILIVQFF